MPNDNRTKFASMCLQGLCARYGDNGSFDDPDGDARLGIMVATAISLADMLIKQLQETEDE